MNSKSFEVFTQVLEYIIRYFKWVVLVALILILLSGIYRVESNEEAIVLRFGELVGDTPGEQIKKPGLHFSFPFFIDEVIKIPVQTVHEKEILTHYGTGEKVSPDIESNGYLLTGDRNVVLIKAMVKYKIENTAMYALYSCDSELAIDGVISGELTRLLTQRDIDTVLTSGKKDLTNQMIANTQALLDMLETGILISSIELTEIIPPLETKSFFEEVINASVNKSTAIQKGKDYAATVLLNAEADADYYVQNAIYEQAYKLTKVREEIAQFNGLYGQYIKDPQIIIDGNFRQRIGILLAGMGASIIVPETGNPVIVLP